MTEPNRHNALCDQLGALLAGGVLTGSHQVTGQRLLDRLTTDIRVSLAGPDVSLKGHLHEALLSQTMHGTTVEIVQANVAIDPSQVDICIWCSATFDVEEAAVWQAVPDTLKDHSFLVTTTQANPAEARLDRGRLDQLADIAAEEFFGLYPIALQHPQSDATGMLLKEVRAMVRSGVMATADTAEMFLAQHQDKRAELSPVAALCVDVPVSSQNDHAFDPAHVYQTGLATMRKHLSGLEPFLSDHQTTPFDKILAICEDTSIAVADHFSASRPACSGPDQFCDEMLTVADRIMLMSAEGDEHAAIAAVTTLLQVRREIEARIPA